MKKFYTRHFEIYWKGKWIRPFRLKDVFVYREPTEVAITEITYTHFKNFYNEMGGLRSWGFEKKTSLIRKKPYVLVEESPFDGHSFRITEKNFRPLKVRWIYDEADGTIIQLARWVSADDFLEYCKDRGVGIKKIF